MNKPHMPHDPAAPPKGLVRAWVEFWFTPTDPIGLHVVRLLSGLLFLTWLLAFAGRHEAFFGLGGWFDAQAYRDASVVPEGAPVPITWSIVYLAGSDPALLITLYWSSVAVLVLFTLGIATRLTAPLTWVVVASYTANPAISYDGDALLIVLAFYLMIGYLLLGLLRPQAWPERILGLSSAWLLGRDSSPSPAANVALRLLQVHFAIILCVSGFHKLQHMEWWAGTSFWFALYPPFESTVEQARRHMPHREFYLVVLSLGAYLALAWQIGFPFFAWRPRWRIVLVGGAVVGWLATAFLYRLPLFGPAILIGSLAFLRAAEWRWLLDRLPGAARRLMAGSTAPAEPRPRRKEAVAATASRTR